ncbi:MAG: hypothetical protein MZV49_06600 [Rhodopseudomonas palustris]|nr:hypothetical protein [Rhodopseudomonas palustris]
MRPVVGDGLGGVGQEIEQNLIDQNAVGLHRGRARGQAEADGYSLVVQLAADQTENPRDRVIDG